MKVHEGKEKQRYEMSKRIKADIKNATLFCKLASDAAQSKLNQLNSCMVVRVIDEK